MDHHVANDASCLDCRSVWARLVSCAHEQRNRDFIDTSDIDKIGLTLTLEVLGRELLESARVSVLLPVSLRLDSHGLAVRAVAVVAGIIAQLAHLLVVSPPVRAVQVIHADRWHLIQGVLIVALWAVRGTDGAGGQRHKLVKVVHQEALFEMGEGVEHLRGSLRPAKVENFVSSAVLLYRLDVCDVVIATHLSPAVLPELLIFNSEADVLLTVLGAAVVANPHVVAGLSELEVHGNSLIIVAEPSGTIAIVAMLDENGRQGGREGAIFVSSHMEGRQDVAIVGGDLHRLPVEVVLLHQVGKSLVVVGLGRDGGHKESGGCESFCKHLLFY
mmetsp:Transcript_33380/g.41234  ORF Transcript_33380/g.41234 Transcript_33380/m.41234 type:complete len:330 (+) Transcript_33380:188-1177(+)